MGDFRKLKVWQRAKELAVVVYKLTGQGAFAKDWGLRDQIRRAAVSIPSNIAEGDELGTDRQANELPRSKLPGYQQLTAKMESQQAAGNLPEEIKFFYIAKGSSAELLTQITIAHEIGYLTEEHCDHIIKECQVISRMLMKLIQARS